MVSRQQARLLTSLQCLLHRSDAHILRSRSICPHSAMNLYTAPIRTFTACSVVRKAPKPALPPLPPLDTDALVDNYREVLANFKKQCERQIPSTFSPDKINNILIHPLNRRVTWLATVTQKDATTYLLKCHNPADAETIMTFINKVRQCSCQYADSSSKDNQNSTQAHKSNKDDKGNAISSKDKGSLLVTILSESTLEKAHRLVIIQKLWERTRLKMAKLRGDAIRHSRRTKLPHDQMVAAERIVHNQWKIHDLAIREEHAKFKKEFA